MKSKFGIIKKNNIWFVYEKDKSYVKDGKCYIETSGMFLTRKNARICKRIVEEKENGV